MELAGSFDADAVLNHEILTSTADEMNKFLLSSNIEMNSVSKQGLSGLAEYLKQEVLANVESALDSAIEKVH